MDLVNNIQSATEQLNTSLRKLRETGTEYAKAEKEYKVLLRQEALKARDSGMAIGMIDKTIYGVPEVAEKRFLRDVAETVYQANKEAINVLKLQIRIMEAQLQREWGHRE